MILSFTVQIMPVCFIRTVQVEVTYVYMDLLLSLGLLYAFKMHGQREKHMYLHLMTLYTWFLQKVLRKCFPKQDIFVEHLKEFNTEHILEIKL